MRRSARSSLQLTDAGRDDPLFGQLPPTFAAQAGHEDHVVELPPDAVLLASSARVPEQAFRFAGQPIYCTQFHPELDRAAMMERVVAYPEYVARIARMPYDEFIHSCRETPEANFCFADLSRWSSPIESNRHDRGHPINELSCC